MKAGERLVPTFECNGNYPVGWKGPAVAWRGKEEIIKNPCSNRYGDASKIKDTFTKRAIAPFLAGEARTLAWKQLNVGQLASTTELCLVRGRLDFYRLEGFQYLKISESSGFFDLWLDKSNYQCDKRQLNYVWMFTVVMWIFYGQHQSKGSQTKSLVYTYGNPALTLHHFNFLFTGNGMNLNLMSECVTGAWIVFSAEPLVDHGALRSLLITKEMQIASVLWSPRANPLFSLSVLNVCLLFSPPASNSSARLSDPVPFYHFMCFIHTEHDMILPPFLSSPHCFCLQRFSHSFYSCWVTHKWEKKNDPGC